MVCSRIIFFSGTLLLVLFTAATGLAVSSDEMTSLFGPEYFKKDPHWAPGGCPLCHMQEARKPELFLRGGDDTLCTVCHERGKASTELHPVGMKAPDKLKIPARFPMAADGKVVCGTCHEHTAACLMKEKKNNRYFVRGGPYEDRLDACYACHPKEDLKTYNPHERQLTDGKIEEKRCLFCHDKALDPKKRVERGQYRLRTKMSLICIGCHLLTPHAGAFEHIEKPSEKTLKNIKEAEGKYGIIFPLDEAGRMTCATCHNPHEKGIFDEGMAAGAKYEEEKVPEEVMKKWKKFGPVQEKDIRYKFRKLKGRDTADLKADPRVEKNMRLSARNGKLCMACHKWN